MVKASVTVKMDPDVKNKASELLSTMGLDMTTAIDMFFRQIITRRELPFTPVAPAISLDEKIVTAAKKLPRYKIETNEAGEVTNFDELPENIQDWIMNG